MKTYKQWEESKKDFMSFAQAGDEIDSKIYWYFLEVLPPAAMNSSGFLLGEPYTHNEDNEPLYEAFYKSPSDRYFFGGLKTVKEFKASSSKEYTLQKCCDTCKPYHRPGWIENAYQWMHCPECNQQKNTLTDEQKRKKYDRGEYRFRAPTVCTDQWDTESWIKFIDSCDGWVS